VEDYLNSVYASNIGVEFEHVHSEEERLWLYENHEQVMHEQLSPSEKIKAL
jgi:2-oxoglutarate dehydrogenase complex dehydrogenase (E1) component-like enzyme